LDRDVQQQTTRKQECERFLQQNQNDLRATERDLERVTRSCEDKQRMREQAIRTCQTSASQVDRRRAAQTDIDRQLSEAQN
ncbi:unnamed protein product, partial [Rotaria magnacalcarata]